MDLHLPRMSGVDATRKLAVAAPAVKVLMLTISGCMSSRSPRQSKRGPRATC